jgi:murein DD-endopeptidase MepM/ murein hydrolase activator NlpD
MGHLKQNAVFVKEGDKVVTGQPLGCAGNSGFSIEPHLHMQAHEKTNNGMPWYRERPLLMEFDGKSYLLFEIIRAGK